MNTPIFFGDGSRARQVGSVEIDDTVDQPTLCNGAIVPMLRKNADGIWEVAAWQLMPRTNVDTRYIELT